LRRFNGRDGYAPVAGVIFDAAGNLYGTTYFGGDFSSCQLGCGVVFELTSTADGEWMERVLHTFNSNGGDGIGPSASLIFDADGNLYGAALLAGAYGCGAVFKLSPTASGRWAENVLHNFKNNSGDGCYPWTNLIFDAAGNLYGTTETGGDGNGGDGVAFEIIP
jgi:uncharacterized repeat protein (TIGR03803 family)